MGGSWSRLPGAPSVTGDFYWEGADKADPPGTLSTHAVTEGIPPTTMKNTKLYPPDPTAYGGSLRNTRKGRARPRPLSSKHSMHLVLRAEKARGPYSFWRPAHKRAVDKIIRKFAVRHQIKVISHANVGNHLHLHVKVTTRRGYNAFIRATTAAIVKAVAGRLKKFWDQRPFTRIAIGRRAYATLQKYIQINQLEGRGYSRAHARFTIDWDWASSG